MTFIKEESLDELEQSPEYQKSLKVVIKHQIQILCHRLSNVGEEMLVLTANLNDGTFSHLGSNKGEQFLGKRQDIEWQFLSFCNGENEIEIEDESHSNFQQEDSESREQTEYQDTEDTEATFQIGEGDDESPAPASHTDSFKCGRIPDSSFAEKKVNNFSSRVSKEGRQDSEVMWDTRTYTARFPNTREANKEILNVEFHQEDGTDNNTVRIKQEPTVVSATQNELDMRTHNELDMREYSGDATTVASATQNELDMRTQNERDMREYSGDAKEHGFGNILKDAPKFKQLSSWTNIPGDDNFSETNLVKPEPGMECVSDPVTFGDAGSFRAKRKRMMHGRRFANDEATPYSIASDPFPATLVPDTNVSCTYPDESQDIQDIYHTEQPESERFASEVEAMSIFAHGRSTSLSNSDFLSVRRKIANQARPFQCQICSKYFPHHCELVRHVRIHTGEKPFKCTMCNKSFAQSSNLFKHQRTHTGERPYGCEVCNRQFTDSGTLKRHKMLHRKL